MGNFYMNNHVFILFENTNYSNLPPLLLRVQFEQDQKNLFFHAKHQFRQKKLVLPMF